MDIDRHCGRDFAKTYCNVLKIFVVLRIGTSVPIHNHRPGWKEKPRMTNVDKLIDYIKNLTPEQADKIICQMPRLIALVEEPCQPDPQKDLWQSQ